MAVVLVGGEPEDTSLEIEWRDFFRKADIPIIFIYNRFGGEHKCADAWKEILGEEVYSVSAKEGEGIDILLEKM